MGRSLRATAPLGAATIASRLLTALWVVVAARLLGVVEFGRFSFLFSIVMTAQALADAGLGALATRRVAARGQLAERTFVLSAFLLQSGLAVLAGAIAAGVAVAVAGASTLAALAVVTGTSMVGIAPLLRGILRATDRVNVDAIVQVLSACLLLATAIAYLRLTPSPGTFLASYALTQVCTTGWLIACALPKGDLRLLSCSALDRRALKAALLEGLPFNVMSTASLVALRTDVIVLNLVLGAVAVGHYAAALQMYQGAWTLGYVAALVGLPRLVRSAGGDRDLLAKKSTKEFLVIMALVGAAIGGLLMVSAQFVLPRIYGSEFQGASVPLQILAASLPLVYANYALGQILIAQGSERVTMLNSLLLAGLALVGFPSATAIHGVAGAACVTSGLTLVSCIFQLHGVLSSGETRGTKYPRDRRHLPERYGDRADAAQPPQRGADGVDDGRGRQLVGYGDRDSRQIGGGGRRH